MFKISVVEKVVREVRKVFAFSTTRNTRLGEKLKIPVEKLEIPSMKFKLTLGILKITI
jgi:hypothetical protein